MKRYIKKTLTLSLLILPLLFISLSPVGAKDAAIKEKGEAAVANKESTTAVEEMDDSFDSFDEFDGEEGATMDEDTIYDPLEPLNRAIFKFNDKLYFWVLKPTAKGYAHVVPERGRLGIKRFFSNLAFPIRFINSILQLKFKSAGIEISRFTINTTIGLLGFMDPAKKWGLEKQDEDFGQTLGHYGLGHGIYINLPFLGPSSLRDGIGLTGDYYLEPETYIYKNDPGAQIAVKAFKVVNDTSLNLEAYDKFVKDAFDPYIFVKNAYYQRRKKQVKE